MPTITLGEETASFLVSVLRGDEDLVRRAETTSLLSALDAALLTEEGPVVDPAGVLDVSYGLPGVTMVEVRHSARQGSEVIVETQMTPWFSGLRLSDTVALREPGDDTHSHFVVRELDRIHDSLSRSEIRLVLVPQPVSISAAGPRLQVNVEGRVLALCPTCDVPHTLDAAGPFTARELVGFTVIKDSPPVEEQSHPTLWERLLVED